MGVVNVTPDSFSDGGRWFDTTAAVKHGLDLVAEGADLVDVGGESTRPGAARVDEAEELRRVIPVVRGLASEGVTVSVDTMRAAVAEQALAAGAALVNDVSGGLADPAMIPAVAAAGAPFVVMHWRGFWRAARTAGPSTRTSSPRSSHELRARMEAVWPAVSPPSASSSTRASASPRTPSTTSPSSPTSTGCAPSATRCWSPRPASGSSAGSWPAPEGAPPPARERDAATAAVSAIAAHQGAWAVRVHEVRATADAVRVARAVEGARERTRRAARSPVSRTDVEQVELANTRLLRGDGAGRLRDTVLALADPGRLGVDEEYHDPARPA